MSLGRIGLYAAIAALSFGVAGLLLGRHRDRRAAPSSRVVPSAGSAGGSPAAVLPPAGPPVQAAALREVEPAPDPRSDALCPVGMVVVEGKTCAEPSRRCAATDEQGRCARYEPSRCRKGFPLRFCIDRYEYPNQKGVVPATLVTFEQARSACSDEGKRLCREMEWAFACEGREGLAFGYDDAHDAARCNAGKEAVPLRAEDLWEPADVVRALANADMRTPSGSMERCSTPFALRDAIGNVEEWVQSDVPGFEAALRGGSYASEGAVCRTVRLIRQTGFREIHTGFRCCRDPLFGPNRAGPVSM